MEIRNTKLVRRLSVLKAVEMKSLKKFVESPYFNKSPILISLLNVLKQFHPNFEAKSCTPEKIFKKIYPEDKAYSQNKLSKRMSELAALVLKFMAAEELERDELKEEALFTKFLSNRKSQVTFEEATKDLKLKLENSPVNSPAIYLQKSMTYHDLYNFSTMKDNVGNIDLMHKTLINLDRFYVLDKLEKVCSLLSRNRLINEKNEPLLKEIQAIEIDPDHLKKDPIFRIYRQLIQLYKDNENDALFFEIKNTFEQIFQALDTKQCTSILFHLLNYSSFRIKGGADNFLNILGHLYKLGLKEELFLVNGILSDITFLNITASASINNDLELLKQLKDVELKKVHVKNQDQIKILLMSYWHFHKGEFNEAHSLLRSLEDKTIFFHFKARVLRLKCLYELQKNHIHFKKNIDADIRSFERQLGRELQLSELNIKALENFLTSLKSLISKYLHQPSQTTIEETKNSILALDPIVGKKWLLEKIDEFKVYSE